MKFRSAVLGLIAGGAVVVSAVSGCGSKADKDPQPVNVKEDPRLKITGDGGGGGRKVEPQKGGDAKALD